jgi:hypothetical protein
MIIKNIATASNMTDLPIATEYKMRDGRTVKVFRLRCAVGSPLMFLCNCWALCPPRFVELPMIDWRFIIPLGLAIASIATSISYLMSPPWQVQAIEPPPTIPTRVQENVVLNEGARPPTADEKALADFEAAADAILRKAPNTRASTATGMPWPVERVPLPKRRPAGAP